MRTQRDVFEEVSSFLLALEFPAEKSYLEGPVGSLIKRGYDPVIEGTSVAEINDSRLPLPGIVALRRILLDNGVNANHADTIEMLYDLQRVHDQVDFLEWSSEVQKLNRKWFGVSTTDSGNNPAHRNREA